MVQELPGSQGSRGQEREHRIVRDRAKDGAQPRVHPDRMHVRRHSVSKPQLRVLRQGLLPNLDPNGQEAQGRSVRQQGRPQKNKEKRKPQETGGQGLQRQRRGPLRFLIC